MIGMDKASVIRAKLRKSLKKSDAELLAWFNEQIDSVRKTGTRGKTEIESLQLLRDALTPKAAPRSNRHGKSRTRKTG